MILSSAGKTATLSPLKFLPCGDKELAGPALYLTNLPTYLAGFGSLFEGPIALSLKYTFPETL